MKGQIVPGDLCNDAALPNAKVPCVRIIYMAHSNLYNRRNLVKWILDVRKVPEYASCSFQSLFVICRISFIEYVAEIYLSYCEFQQTYYGNH